MFKQQHILKSRLIVTDWLTLGLLCLALMLLTACRSASSTIKVEAEIEPEPIVGEIVTLRIEAVSEKFSGEGLIAITPANNINILGEELEWHGTTDCQPCPWVEWHGPVTAGEPFTYDLTFCITHPGETGFYIQAAVVGKDWGENKLHIYSTVESAEVIPASDYEWHQPPLGSTPTPTPEPVVVSPECTGNEQ